MHVAISFEAFVKALSWSLLHSLWIGVITAFLAGIVILATRKKTAAVRYNTLSTLLFLFFGFTVLFAVKEFVSAFSTENNSNIINTQVKVAGTQVPGQFEDSVFSKAINLFNENANYLMLAWFIIFAFKLMRLVYGVSRMASLRHQQLVGAPVDWMQRLELLKNQLKIRKPIQLFESYLVKIPVTLGHLRPVILFPVGTLTGLPPAQLDAVLLHELAHIRRNDYLVNIIQLAMESIFFFNPCLLWISSLIRKERENCCDDMAIHTTNSRKDFLSALLSFQNLAFEEVRLAQSFMVSKTLLIDRARRIAHEHNTTLNKIERKFLVFAVALLAIFIFRPKTNIVESGVSAVAKYFQNIKGPEYKNAGTPLPEKQNQHSNLSSQEPVGKPENELEHTYQPIDTNIQDTGKLVRIVPVTVNRNVIRYGNTIVSDTVWGPPKPRPAFSRSDPFIASVITDLKNEGLIKDEGEKYSFILSNEKLCVNGVTQPEDIHQKIFRKYIPDPKLEHINIYYTCCN